MGNNERTGRITCKLPDELMRPYFPCSAVEMRKKVKADKIKANKIASEGAANALSDFKKLSTCHMRLVCSGEDLFRDTAPNKQIDGQDALLEIYKREELVL